MARTKSRDALQMVSVRVPVATRRKIRAAAAEAGLTESSWLRIAIAAALDAPARNGEQEDRGAAPAIASRDEALALLTKAARAGDVPSIKALVRELSAPERGPGQAKDEPPAQAPRKVDELAAARRRRGAG